jgi:predicted porin
MKKSLFALAAVTAFAGAAQAQSSVTVYGILDVGYIGGNERVATGSAVTKQNVGTFGQSAQSTSRLGFRGTEDLGGGMSAFFNLEVAVTPNSAASSLAGSGTANRAGFVGLAQKGVGRVAVGLQNTVVTDAIGPTLTGQFNNIVGSMLFPGNSNLGPSGIRSSTGDVSYVNTNSANGNTEAFTFRTSNTLKLQTERMAGIQLGAMYVMNNQTTTQGAAGTNRSGYSGGKNDQSGWGLGANYQFKKLIVTAAYQSLTASDPYAVVITSTAASQNTTTFAVTPAVTAGQRTAGGEAAFTSVGTGSNVKDNQAYVGATYDFGILKAYAGWIDRKVTSQISSNFYAKRTAQEIGVRGNWTPKIESWASIGNGRITTFGNGSPTANLIGWQVGTNYILSKRTNLYAIYGENGTSNVSTVRGANPQSFNSNNYALGVRHTF